MPGTMLKSGDMMMGKKREGPGLWGTYSHREWRKMICVFDLKITQINIQKFPKSVTTLIRTTKEKYVMGREHRRRGI